MGTVFLWPRVALIQRSHLTPLLNWNPTGRKVLLNHQVQAQGEGRRRRTRKRMHLSRHCIHQALPSWSPLWPRSCCRPSCPRKPRYQSQFNSTAWNDIIQLQQFYHNPHIPVRAWTQDFLGLPGITTFAVISWVPIVHRLSMDWFHTQWFHHRSTCHWCFQLKSLQSRHRHLDIPRHITEQVEHSTF